MSYHYQCTNEPQAWTLAEAGENDINSLEYNFDLTNLPNGVYQLKVIFVDTSTNVSKLCLIK